MPADFGELSRTVIFPHALSAVQAAQAGADRQRTGRFDLEQKFS